MAKHFRTGSRASEVHQWLRDNPGFHAPHEVGLSLQITTHQAAVTLSNLLTRGLAVREDRRYSAPPTTLRVHRR